jgi:hypothetical protein
MCGKAPPFREALFKFFEAAPQRDWGVAPEHKLKASRKVVDFPHIEWQSHFAEILIAIRLDEV